MGAWGGSGVPHTPRDSTSTISYPSRRCSDASWIVVATAHPAKFDSIVEPATGTTVPVPPALAALLELPSRWESIDPELKEFSEKLDEW